MEQSSCSELLKQFLRTETCFNGFYFLNDNFNFYNVLNISICVQKQVLTFFYFLFKRFEQLW